jgi:hypothetical protein
MGYERETNVKRELASPEAQKMFKQFMKNPEGFVVNKDAYERGHTFSFDFTQEERDRVNEVMSRGFTFEEAFDAMYPSIMEARKK